MRIKNFPKIVFLSLLVASGGLRLSSFVLAADGGINQQMPYSGRVVDTGGLPISNGSYSMKFVLYSVVTGGSGIFEEIHDGIQDYGNGACTKISTVDGKFSSNIGSCNTLTADVLNKTAIYLEIQLDYDNNGSYEEVFTPRKRLASAPAAFNAVQLVADGVGASTNTMKINSSGNLVFKTATQNIFTVNPSGDIAGYDGTGKKMMAISNTIDSNLNIGAGAGNAQLAGALANVLVGYESGRFITDGDYNVGVGYQSLYGATSGTSNTAVGNKALYSNVSGNQNTIIGKDAGYLTTGSGNVLIGYQAGYNETGNNKLYIANSNTATPLIYGDFSTGYIGLGLNNPSYRIDLPNTATAAGQGRANAWTTYSSVRWKENIVTMEGALAKIRQLRGVYYDPKGGGDKQIGFIAEEVGKVLPELVEWESDGVYAKSLKYDRINALTVEAIKDLDKSLNGTQRNVSDIGTKIANVEKNLSSLTELVRQEAQNRGVLSTLTVDKDLTVKGDTVLNNLLVKGKAEVEVLAVNKQLRVNMEEVGEVSSNFALRGSVEYAVKDVASDYFLGNEDHILRVNASGGEVFISLPNAQGLMGREYMIKKIDGSGNQVVVKTSLGQTLDGQQEFRVNSQYQTLRVISSGEGWDIISR
jgi:hypothetical protein